MVGDCLDIMTIDEAPWKCSIITIIKYHVVDGSIGGTSKKEIWAKLLACSEARLLTQKQTPAFKKNTTEIRASNHGKS